MPTEQHGNKHASQPTNRFKEALEYMKKALELCPKSAQELRDTVRLLKLLLIQCLKVLRFLELYSTKLSILPEAIITSLL